MTLEERIDIVRRNYPDPMSQQQFGEAVGLRKSSTYKLVRDGVIPYENVSDGLKHYHMIRKEDVIRFLEKKYAHAAVAYISAGRRCVAMMLHDEPEILTMKDVMRITGLWKSAAQKWLTSGKLRGFYYIHSMIIRKEDLIRFMASPEYQDSSHKNIRAQAVTMAVEWYSRVSEQMKGGNGRGTEE